MHGVVPKSPPLSEYPLSWRGAYARIPPAPHSKSFGVKGQQAHDLVANILAGWEQRERPIFFDDAREDE